ncbi:AraC family transcriptional regulator [Solwaraspora sp. WMMD406]|uniref:AraC family transcriptional regulator n=1 Tax=Solwaraspora sp. WMMD406 TaxID=3016095 RepID=UPI0024179045|nr:AraC family transcriptional regulator [Solwaraspora sp. WMMD406]MDG4767940.1 AraC family transcriptional regulator [Solwaraspora sp. WMMD406]
MHFTFPHTGTGPVRTDPLGETLHLFRLTGTLYCRAELTAPWGVDVPAMPGCMALQVVTAGQCWLEVAGEQPRLVGAGSLTLIPHGVAHRFRSDPSASTRPLADIPVRQLSERYEIMRHGGGGELTQVAYAVLRVDHVAARRLAAQLPAVLQLDRFDDDESGWLHSTLRLIARESQALRPGGETMLTRLADVLVIQVIRMWLDAAPEARQGWLAALRDEQLGRALTAVHRAPERDWTVATLAREAGMSRSAFAARFTGLVGEPVIRYLAAWRLQLAHDHLRGSGDPLPVVARRFGYQSEAAFCRAFKREYGVPPGQVRRAGVATGWPTTSRVADVDPD